MIWSMFTNVPVPYTNMTFAHLFLGTCGAWALIKFLKVVIGFDYSEGDNSYKERYDWWKKGK